MTAKKATPAPATPKAKKPKAPRLNASQTPPDAPKRKPKVEIAFPPSADAMKGVVIDDDKWIRRLTSERMEPDALPARVVVTITAIATAQPQMALV